MTNPVNERVARALFEATHNMQSGWRWHDDHLHAQWVGYARAAIAAMREPTEEMVEAGWQEGMAGFGEGEECEPVWRATIDAALKEG